MARKFRWPGMLSAIAGVEDQRGILTGDAVTCQPGVLSLFGDLFYEIFIHGAKVRQRK